jgi:hypothetical protein
MLAHHSVLFIDRFTQYPQGRDRGSGPRQSLPAGSGVFTDTADYV